MNFTAQNPFVYQLPSSPFDWRLFASTDVEGAIATQNIPAMLTLVDNLAFGELEAPVGLQRVFRAQQFMLQYLIYVQSELTQQLANVPNGDYEQLRLENQRLRRELQLERQKRQSDNMMLRLASLKPELIEAMPRCLECGKAFADYRYLVSHYQRRHPGKQIPPPPLPNYKIERPEYKLCNCKLEAPPPAPPQSKLTSNKVSDIFMDNDDMMCKIEEKRLHESGNNTDPVAASPGLYRDSPQYRSLDSTAVLKPQQANFSMNSTSRSAVGIPTQQATGVKTAVYFDPEGAYNSFSSENGRQVIPSAYTHSKQELGDVYE